MPKFSIQEVASHTPHKTARVGGALVAGSTAHLVTDAEVGKFVKLAGESRFDLCVLGDQIEGRLDSLNVATQDGYTIGGVNEDGPYLRVTFDGAQASPGTGAMAIGDFVVTGTPVAKGTPLAWNLPARVVRATAAGNTLNFKWRVVSLGDAGTGAPGTVGYIQRVS